jgi:hypothetical protein
MRAFTCPVCRHLVTFESTQCLQCGTALGFDWEARTLVAGGGCANRDLIGCNGLDPGLCTACALTRTRPPDEATAQFAVAEAAKRRLVFELLELGLPIDGGLRFDFLSSAHGPVTTGHADGVITLDLAETDPVHREQTRTELDEPYRTVLGHLRHEIGHYYQPILAPEGSPALERCRELMGDDRQDYSRRRHGAAVLVPRRRTRRVPRDARRLVPPDLRAERDQPQPRRERPLPVRARPGGDRQARVHRLPGPQLRVSGLGQELRLT